VPKFQRALEGDVMKHALHDWLGPDGKPDPHKMLEFIEHQDRSQLLDVIGWAVFFVWAGTAWLLEIGLGWGIIGTGILLLALQALRAMVHTKVDVFWIIVAMAFVVGGFWELWEIAIPLAPVALIAIGIGLLVWYCTKTLNRRKRMF
jgi:hypothetical protein